MPSSQIVRQNIVEGIRNQLVTVCARWFRPGQIEKILSQWICLKPFYANVIEEYF